MKKARKTFSLDEYRSVLTDVAATLSEFDEPLSELGETAIEDIGTGAITEVTVSDIFDVQRGKGKYTKAYIQKHQGEFPVYSGNTVGAFAHIDSYDYDVPCLSWAIDGLAGYIMIHSNLFSATNHRGVLVPKVEGIDLQYIRYVLEPIFRELKMGRAGDNGENEYTSLPPSRVKNAKFSIPVKEDGTFDLGCTKGYSSEICIY